MTKIWAEAFWKPHPAGIEPRLSALDVRTRVVLLAPIAGLAALTILIGFYPEPFVAFAERAAGQLIEPTEYVKAVLGRTS